MSEHVEQISVEQPEVVEATSVQEDVVGEEVASETPETTEAPSTAERSPSACTQMASKACETCAISGTCPILAMKQNAAEQRDPTPDRTDYTEELLSEGPGLVIAGYQPKIRPPVEAPPVQKVEPPREERAPLPPPPRMMAPPKPEMSGIKPEPVVELTNAPAPAPPDKLEQQHALVEVEAVPLPDVPRPIETGRDEPRNNPPAVHQTVTPRAPETPPSLGAADELLVVSASDVDTPQQVEEIVKIDSKEGEETSNDRDQLTQQVVSSDSASPRQGPQPTPQPSPSHPPQEIAPQPSPTAPSPERPLVVDEIPSENTPPPVSRETESTNPSPSVAPRAIQPPTPLDPPEHTPTVELNELSPFAQESEDIPIIPTVFDMHKAADVPLAPDVPVVQSVTHTTMAEVAYPSQQFEEPAPVAPMPLIFEEQPTQPLQSLDNVPISTIDTTTASTLDIAPAPDIASPISTPDLASPLDIAPAIARSGVSDTPHLASTLDIAHTPDVVPTLDVAFVVNDVPAATDGIDIIQTNTEPPLEAPVTTESQQPVAEVETMPLEASEKEARVADKTVAIMVEETKETDSTSPTVSFRHLGALIGVVAVYLANNRRPTIVMS